MPRNDVLLLEGSLLKLQCKSVICRIGQAHDFFFDYKGKEFPSKVGHNCTVIMQVPQVTKEHSGIYHCLSRNAQGPPIRAALSKKVIVFGT